MVDYEFRIPVEKMVDSHIYGKYIIEGKYGFLGKEVNELPNWVEFDKNYLRLDDKSMKRNTFVMAILNQIMPDYRYFDVKSRIQFVKDLFNQIANDMEEKSLYKNMEYTRKRNHIRKIFHDFDDIDGDNELKKVIVDYFSLTVYIVKKNEKFGKKRLIEKISFLAGEFRGSERRDEYMLKNPSCILLEEGGRYTSIIKKDLRGLLVWQDDGMEELLREIYLESEVKRKPILPGPVKELEVKKELVEVMEVMEENVEEKVVKHIEIPKKITLQEIQELAKKEGISITKKSDKTGKDLKKTIQELREEIMKKFI